ncbi:MAG TPA: RluA family pseudouridine synthase [Acidimicrobiales bacterium]|nr:RluA family pseudouridine synthase [Acidimicrobiales bacterium]
MTGPEVVEVREVLPAGLAGERLDRVVAMVTGRSRAEVAALVDDGVVRIDGRPVTKASLRVREGAVLEVALPPLADAPTVAAEADVAFRVVHADDHVIVVDKPAGVVVHPGAGNARGTLVAGLLDQFPEIASVGDPERPGVVHRIDRGTSGLLLVARSAEGYTSLVDQLSSRSVERAYRALAWGRFASPRGLIDAAIGRSGRDPTRMAVSAKGREARTRYEVLAGWSDPAVTLVECRLDTGRTHQIRVHLAAIGHPVVGDTRYGGARSTLPLGRPFLHAAEVGFTHPVSGEHLGFESPLPADLVAVLDGLGDPDPTATRPD